MSLTEPSLPLSRHQCCSWNALRGCGRALAGFQPRRTVQPWDTRFADFLSQIFMQTPQNRAVTVRTYDCDRGAVNAISKNEVAQTARRPRPLEAFLLDLTAKGSNANQGGRCSSLAYCIDHVRYRMTGTRRTPQSVIVS